MDGGRRGVLRGLGRDDRHRPVRAGQRGFGSAGLVGVRGRAGLDHGGRLFWSGVDRLFHTLRVTTRTRQPAAFEPIARVLPMLSVPHLDREFDYLVSEEQSDDAQPGVRVRLRFHGRLVDGFVLERRTETDHVGKLAWLDRVVSAEPVLTPEIRRLVDAVAARYAGTRADVLRLGVPPRHAKVERENQTAPELSVVSAVDRAGWEAYGSGGQFLTALAESRAARAVWQGGPRGGGGGPLA